MKVEISNLLKGYDKGKYINQAKELKRKLETVESSLKAEITLDSHLGVCVKILEEPSLELKRLNEQLSKLLSGNYAGSRVSHEVKIDLDFS